MPIVIPRGFLVRGVAQTWAGGDNICTADLEADAGETAREGEDDKDVRALDAGEGGEFCGGETDGAREGGIFGGGVTGRREDPAMRVRPSLDDGKTTARGLDEDPARRAAR